MIAIVTETLSCLTPADCAAFGVSLIPMTCAQGDRGIPDRLLAGGGAEIDGGWHSAPPTEADYRAHFGALLDAFDGVLCITASRRISASHRHATMAAVPFGGRVVVLDSHSVAGGLYLLVIRARHFITLGYPMSRIKAELESYRNTLRVSFTADSADVLRRAHRLSFRMPSERPMPDRRPVFHIRRGGIGVMTYAAQGNTVMDELLSVLEADGACKPPSHAVVHYIERTPAVAYLVERIACRYPSATVYERPITLSLQVNLGWDIVGLIGD